MSLFRYGLWREYTRHLSVPDSYNYKSGTFWFSPEDSPVSSSPIQIGREAHPDLPTVESFCG